MATTTKKSGFQIPKSQGEIVMRSQVSPPNVIGSSIQRSGKLPKAKAILSTSTMIGTKSRPIKVVKKTGKRLKVSNCPNAPMKSKTAREFFMEATREGQS